MVVGNNPEGDGTVLSFHLSTLQTAMKKLSGNLSLDITEQVTGFKYLRYRISEYKSDL